MTWIDWVTVACLVFVVLLFIAEWGLLGYQQQLRAKLDLVDGALYTSGVFRFNTSAQIEASEPVVAGPDGSVLGFIGGDERFVLGFAIEASVPIPGDPDGRHKVTVLLGPRGFIDEHGGLFVQNSEGEFRCQQHHQF